MSGGGGSAEHRIGLVPCPLCKNIEVRRLHCKACDRAGMIGVDRAIEIGVAVSDTEREMSAVAPPDTEPAPAPSSKPTKT